jgi:hypothetical protein
MNILVLFVKCDQKCSGPDKPRLAVVPEGRLGIDAPLASQKTGEQAWKASGWAKVSAGAVKGEFVVSKALASAARKRRRKSRASIL